MFGATYLRSKLSLRGLQSKALVRTFLIACLPLAKATTDWALSDASIVISDVYLWNWYTPDAQMVGMQAFKSYYCTKSPNLYSQIKMDL